MLLVARKRLFTFCGKGSSHVTKSCVRRVVCCGVRCWCCQNARRIRQPGTLLPVIHTDENTSSDTWQYYRTDAGVAGYTLNTNLFDWGGGQYAWANYSQDNYVCNIPSLPTQLDMAPSLQDAAIGWMSPITGKVDVSYSLTMPNIVGQTTNGIETGCFRARPSWAMASSPRVKRTGSLIAPNLSVEPGDMLYLRIGDNGGYGYDDTRFTMTVTSVPEPTAVVLLATGLLGLLAYAWKKQK